jgi:hypothetical protein
MSMKSVLALFFACVAWATVGYTAARYNFRESDAYARLSKDDRAKLEQIHRDFMMLWGALDKYCDDHAGRPPETLSELVPFYLAELPADPFATKETANGKKLGAYKVSKDGWGYRYRKGAMYGQDDRAWVLSSVGLPDFPYLAERSNVGLYICKGIWL